eukprot:Platyproteum_vivax@DN6324_c0_g2_i2.p1
MADDEEHMDAGQEDDEDNEDENDLNEMDEVEEFDVLGEEDEAIGAPKPRLTSPYMTKFEKARILGTRALQISMNAPLTIDPPLGITDPLVIAEQELGAKKIPFVVRRFLPDGTYEDWSVAELIQGD